MADLTRSAVEIRNTWYTGLGKQIRNREVRVELTGQGDATDTIPADAVDLHFFEGPSLLTEEDDSTIVVGAPSTDKKTLLLKAAASNAPATYTGYFTGVISGR